MPQRGKAHNNNNNNKTAAMPAVAAAAAAHSNVAHHPNGRSAVSVAAAAAEARRQNSLKVAAAAVAAAAAAAAAAAEDDDHELRDADVDYVPADPLDDEAPPASSLLTFMRRSRSDSAANDHHHQHALFRMDSDEVAAHHPAAAPHRIPRRGSVEAEMQLPLPDEDTLLEGTVPLEIGRADSPEVDEEEKEGEKGVELESALINRAAAAAAAAASAPASAYRSAIAARPPGGLSVGDFELLSVVGRGAYGKVFLVRAHATGRLYAMKVVMKSEAIRKNVVANMLAEKNVLEAVRHPFIVNLRFAFQSESKLYLVLDYISGGELFARLDASKDHSLSLKECRFYAAEIVLAIEHLHKNNIIYRDLKPENVLLTRDGHLCLTDFGFAKESIAEAGSGTKSFCGTLHYMSPEMIQYSGHGKGSDWWALGALLHEMLTGSTPFSGNNRKVIQDNILTAPLKLPKWMDNPTKSILTELLRRPISKRLGCGPDGAAAIKKHAFFAGIDWVALAQKKVPAPFVPPMSEAGEACTRNFDVRFTAERAVDTPVSPSQMAHVLAGHGISPGAFLTADATFANFAYKRDHTPAASPMLRGLDPSMIRRQGSTGSSNAGVPIGSPRPLSGLPPPHHVLPHHLQPPHPESLELTPPAKAAAAAATTATAAPQAAESADAAWPTLDPAVLKQREQQAAAKAAARKAAQQNQASPPPSATVAASATASASVASPPRVKKPKPVKANASPPAPVDTASPLPASPASAAAAASASPTSPATATAAASPSSARSGPSGGASSQLSKQLAARQQNNQQQQAAAQTPSQAPTAAAAVRPPPGRGWEGKSAAAPSSAAPAPSLPLSPPPPPPPAGSAVAPAPAASAAAAASAAPSALGIRVLGGIKSLAPVPAPAAASAASGALPPAAAPASSSSASAAPSSSSVLSSPLRLSAAAKVFIPGQWGAPKPPAAAAVVPTAAPTPAATAATAGPPVSAAKPIAATAAPAAAAVAPAPVAAAAIAAPSNPLGPARWGAKTSAPAPIPQKRG